MELAQAAMVECLLSESPRIDPPAWTSAFFQVEGGAASVAQSEARAGCQANFFHQWRESHSRHKTPNARCSPNDANGCQSHARRFQRSKNNHEKKKQPKYMHDKPSIVTEISMMMIIVII